MLVKRIQGIQVWLGGESHQGWVPPNAVAPGGTSARVVELDLEIQERGDAYQLVWTGPSEECCGDSWHLSVASAMEEASRALGINDSDWTDAQLPPEAQRRFLFRVMPVDSPFQRTMRFPPGAAGAWVMFVGGLGGYSGVHAHPNGRDVLVFSSGGACVVDPGSRRVKEELSVAVAGVYEVHAPPGLICNEQGLAFFRIGPTGIVWRTRRLSVDGFEDVELRRDKLIGRGRTADYETTAEFEVDLRTGRSTGGLISPLEEDGREQLAEP